MINKNSEVIMYHYIKDKWHNDKHYFLTTAIFEKQIRFFIKEKGIINLNEFLEGKPGYLLTFDDGLKDHVKYVMPILEKYNIKGCFYICSLPYLERKIIPAHLIHILLYSIDHKRLYQDIYDLSSVDFGKQGFEVYKDQNLNKYEYLIKKFLNYEIESDFRDEILDYLDNKYSISKKWFKDYYMNENDLRSLNNLGHVIGSHSHNHNLFGKMEYSMQEQDIQKSIKCLESIINKKINSFCYPFGGLNSLNEDTKKILKNNNIECAFNVEGDFSDLHQIARIDCNKYLINGN